MQFIYQLKIKTLILLVISPFLLLYFVNPPETFSKKAKKTSELKKKKKKKASRHYNPQKTKAEALNILNSSSANYLLQLANGEIEEDDFILLDSLILDQGDDPIELEIEDDKPIDLDVFRTMYISYVEGDDYMQIGGNLFSGISKKKIMENILKWLGTPYYFGGTTNRGIDCSAFTRQIFYSSARILLPRTAREQINIGIPIKRNRLEFGDLVFFHTRRHAYVSHVGIYLGDNLFVHSSSRYGVTVSSLESKYYSSRFIGARRLTPNDFSKLSKSEAFLED
ncbi:MAG: NlpC/P60 family protein [Ignavibacteria bacterium]|nr:NlpC/P60 family protein [Ignavibacteria bacterium]